MTTRLAGAIAAGTLSLGVLVGAAGTAVARGDTTPDAAAFLDHTTAMAGMTQMMQMNAARMMGAGSPMMGSSVMPGSGLMSPGQHRSHHPSPTPTPPR